MVGRMVANPPMTLYNMRQLGVQRLLALKRGHATDSRPARQLHAHDRHRSGTLDLGHDADRLRFYGLSQDEEERGGVVNRGARDERSSAIRRLQAIMPRHQATPIRRGPGCL